MATKLTKLEKTIFPLLYKSSDGNGHDFGCLNDLFGWKGCPKPRLPIPTSRARALVTTLQTKGLIVVHPLLIVNDNEKVMQFIFTEEGFAVAKSLELK